MIRRLVIAAFLLGSALAAQAAPTLSGFSGDTAHGGSVTLTGTDFLTKSTAAPFTFDTVESGAFSANWKSAHDLAVNSDNNRSSRSTKNGYLNFRAGFDDGYFTSTDTVTSSKWIVSYWVKLGANWDWGTTDASGTNKFLSNIKLFREWNPSGALNENYVIATQGWGNQMIADLEDTGATYDATTFFPNLRTVWTLGTWHHLLFIYGEASGLNVTDGFIQMYFDGVSMGSRLTRTRINEAFDKRPLIVGLFNSWGPSDPPSDPSDDAPNDMYIDDVYVDTTWARIELGDNLVYGSCAHREMQSPTAWSTNSASFTVNRGSFLDSDPVYAFLCDSAGDCSAGLPLFESGGGGGGGGGTKPAVPSAAGVKQ